MKHSKWDITYNENLKENIRNLNKMKIKLKSLIDDSQQRGMETSLSSSESYLSNLINLFSFDTSQPLELLKDKLENIASKQEELASMGIPVLVGFYIVHAETYPTYANEVWKFLLKQAEKDVKISHLIIFNLLTCKHTYKKHIEFTKLKGLVCDIMNNFDYYFSEMNGDESKHKDIKHYHSLFYAFESFEEFVDKNLLRLDNMKKYVINGKIQMNQILLNLKKANNNSNPKWESYCDSLIFVNDLILISELLCRCPIKDRDRILNEFIMTINRQGLPAKIYDPFSENKDSHNSFLWRISEDYSYPISTKERVPCHLLLEFSNTENANLNNETVALRKSKRNFIIKDIPTKTPYENNERPSIIIPRVTKEKTLFEYFGISGSNEPTSSTVETASSNVPATNGFFGAFLGCFTGNRTEIETKYKNEEESNNQSTPDSIGIFGNKKFKEIQNEVLNKSKYKAIPNRYISSVIIKGNDDLRQDYFVSQLVKLFNSIFIESNLEIHLQPVEVLSNGNGGFIQTIVNSTNLTKINKLSFPYEYQEPSSESSDEMDIGNLKKYFKFKYGKETEEYRNALGNFISSLTGYSLLCYFLEVKDRNNGNILIDDDGNLIHIDFGFLLSKSPGNISFEKAPFKFTSDFVSLLQGTQSQYFMKFQELFEKGFKAIRNKSNLIIAYVLIFSELFSDLPIFNDRELLITSLKQKFCFEMKTNEEIMTHCNSLIFTSINNWRTKAYDQFQKYCVGIN